MDKKPVIVIGAGGHARSVIPLLRNFGFDPQGIYDDSWRAGLEEVIFGCKVQGNVDALPDNSKIVLAVGNNSARSDYFKRLQDSILKENVIHSTAHLEIDTRLGAANLVFPKVFINAAALIGDNNIINSGSIIEHECILGSHSHISVGAILSGRVKVGSYCFIGAGAVVRDKISICDHVTVGAGAVVVKDIVEPGLYAGCPARKLK